MISKIKLKELLSKDKVFEVIEHLNQVQTPDNDLKNAITIIAGQLNQLEKQYHQGVLFHEEYVLQSNRIRHSLLIIIEELPDNVVLSSFSSALRPK